MSDVIEKARKRLEVLEAEAAQLRSFLDVYKTIESADWAAIQDSVEAEIGPKAQRDEPIRGHDKPKRVVKYAKIAINEARRPLTRTQLVKELESRGLVIGGTDKSKNMGTILWRSGQFDNIEGEGYWPKDAPPWDATLRELGL